MSIWKGLRFFIGKLPSFSVLGYNSRRIKWQPLTLDFTGQVWVVTGASHGIGAAIAEAAALAGAKVVVVARSTEKLNALKMRVATLLENGEGTTRTAKNQGLIIPAKTDLSDMQAVDALAVQLNRKLKVDVLINNVGILNNDHKTNKQGLEESYAVNLLGQYLLTQKLLETRTIRRAGLILNMASGGLYNQPLNTELLNQPELNYDGMMGYASHKRAQLSLTDHWRRQHKEQELFAYTMHPGWVKTAGVKKSLPLFNKILKPLLRTAEQAADTALWLAQKRPATRENVVWFDRKPRSPYLFQETKHTSITTNDLLEYLDTDVEKTTSKQLVSKSAVA